MSARKEVRVRCDRCHLPVRLEIETERSEDLAGVVGTLRVTCSVCNGGKLRLYVTPGIAGPALPRAGQLGQ